MQDHATRNYIWDRSKLGTCFGVLGTVDQLVLDRTILDEVKGQQINPVVAFYDNQKAYEMVRHDWMIRVCHWVGAPEKLIEVIKKLMKGWKTKLEVAENRQKIVSRLIIATRGFLQGDSFSPVGFCLTEVPVAMLMEGSDGCKIRKGGKRVDKRTHSLFIDDLKIYQENLQKLQIVNEMIAKALIDTGAYNGFNKCAEIVFRKGKMVKSEGLQER